MSDDADPYVQARIADLARQINSDVGGPHASEFDGMLAGRPYSCQLPPEPTVNHHVKGFNFESRCLQCWAAFLAAVVNADRDRALPWNVTLGGITWYADDVPALRALMAQRVDPAVRRLDPVDDNPTSPSAEGTPNQ